MRLANDINDLIQHIVEHYVKKTSFNHNDFKVELQKLFPEVGNQPLQINFHCINFSKNGKLIQLIESIDFCYNQELEPDHCTYFAKSNLETLDTETCKNNLLSILPKVEDIFKYSGVKGEGRSKKENKDDREDASSPHPQVLPN